MEPIPISILTAEETSNILKRWEAEGPSEEEREDFLARSLDIFTDPRQAAALAEDVAHLAELATQIDKTFVDVEKILLVVVAIIWPIGIPLLAEWHGYKKRWRECLRTSVGLASTTAETLKRFDEIYLLQVETIQTEQDRLSAIQSLQSFVVELDRNDQSAGMSRDFLDLKRDIEAFVNRFNTSAMQTAVGPLLQDIEALDEQIKSAQKAISGARAGIVQALGIGAKCSSVVASLKDQREQKIQGLRNIHDAMKALNELVIPASAQTRWDKITAPDIGLMLNGLVVFAEIWSSIRSQTVQFSEHLKGGLGAATNIRFKNEVKLARAQCQPLEAGLLDYKKQLESWI